MFSFNAGNAGRVALMAAALALAGGNVAFAQDTGGAAPPGKAHSITAAAIRSSTR